MKKIIKMLLLPLTTLPCITTTISCSSKSDIYKIVTFKDPKTNTRWQEIMSTYSSKVNEIWNTYESNWVQKIDDSYETFKPSTEYTTFNSLVNQINSDQSTAFKQSHELQLIMAYQISYDYCALKKPELSDSQSLINIDNDIEFMYEGYTFSSGIFVEHPAIFYQSITYPNKFDGVDNGTSIDINYNTEVDSVSLDNQIISRLKQCYDIVQNGTSNNDNDHYKQKKLELGDIYFNKNSDITSDIIKQKLLDTYNDTDMGKSDIGVDVEELTLNVNSTSATIYTENDNEVILSYNIKTKE